MNKHRNEEKTVVKMMVFELKYSEAKSAEIQVAM